VQPLYLFPLTLLSPSAFITASTADAGIITKDEPASRETKSRLPLTLAQGRGHNKQHSSCGQQHQLQPPTATLLQSPGTASYSVTCEPVVINSIFAFFIS